MATTHSYHHGNLRQAALDAARATVAQKGHDAIAMRELAQQLQVSPTALYRHFANRTALLIALANAVHEELQVLLRQAVARQEDPWEALRASLRLFLTFTEQNEGLFRMMYDDEVINAPDADTLLPGMAANYQLMHDLFRRVLPSASPSELRLRLISMWSTLYGYASLRSHGSLKSYMLKDLTRAKIEKAVLQTALGVA